MPKVTNVGSIEFTHIVAICATQRAVHSIISVRRNVIADVYVHRHMRNQEYLEEHVFPSIRRYANGIGLEEADDIVTVI